MEHVVESAAVENHAAEEERLSLKEYWGHVWELMKYFFKYFGIAIAETAKRFWSWFLRFAQKNRLIKAVDEDGNTIEFEDDDDEILSEEDMIEEPCEKGEQEMPEIPYLASDEYAAGLIPNPSDSSDYNKEDDDQEPSE